MTTELNRPEELTPESLKVAGIVFHTLMLSRMQELQKQKLSIEGVVEVLENDSVVKACKVGLALIDFKEDRDRFDIAVDQILKTVGA